MIEIKDLTCGYQNFLLKDINLKIQRGEFVGIIGPNGSGKTTLLKAITKVIKPQKGFILLDGIDICKMSLMELAKKVAIVSVNSDINFMKVEEFILLGRLPYYRSFQFFETKKDLEVVNDSMELVGILKFKDRYLSELSAGERQLVYIAKALAQQPQVFLLDEPISHLDIYHQLKILNVIKKLNKEFNLTIILVFHDLNLASEYCNRLIILDNGRIYKDSDSAGILNSKVIEEVYKAKVVEGKNPVSKKPYIFLIPENRG